MIRKFPRAVVSVVVAAIVSAGILTASEPAGAHHGRDIDSLWLQTMGRPRHCLDAPPGTMGRDGGAVKLHYCHDAGAVDQANQRWYMEWDAAATGYRIKLEPTGKCLEATKADGRLQLWACNGADHQLWKLIPLTDEPSRIGGSHVPAEFRHPYWVWNKYHTDKANETRFLAATSKSTVGLQGFRSGDKDHHWDSYELQCMYAYKKHYDGLRNACR
ncbi:ricin-type beta-trefoil lectin protein [Krasilnikovia cinnamomea]|uniref:Ricin-type beta-trefoil lectin protein n=1 Tax=Krasilnikovia cinnamomea TaxID=349313 RepID=A0A4Q7ZQ97_9ACTN|nr:RICIN domain-containing protein [Krasilnikovia cinnamomea]RZU53277.1 ricin-type beta-trefoil lectin protein [Krasilnikovia cinnamomea]